MLATEEADAVESRTNPHREVHRKLEIIADADQGTEGTDMNAMRLSKEICQQYGFSDKCAKCKFYQSGEAALRKRNHSVECRTGWSSLTRIRMKGSLSTGSQDRERVCSPRIVYML